MNIAYDRNAINQLEIRFADDCSFDEVKDLLKKYWAPKQTDQYGTYDQGWVDFTIQQQTIALHWDVFAGLCLISREPTGEALLRRTGSCLEEI